MRPRICFRVRALSLALALFAVVRAEVSLSPFKASGIYQLGEKAGWKVSFSAGGDTAAAPSVCHYTLKKNGAEPIQSGDLEPSRPTEIAATLDEPATLYLEISSSGNAAKPIVAGAAIAPEKLQPVVPRPADFDAFWDAKIKLLHATPMAAVLTPGTCDKPGVEYATIRMNNIGGAHVYGQIAKPAREGKFPAMLIMQWASPPYPLQKAWVVDRAAEGWLALDVEPHDVPGDMPAEFYAALPHLIKDYTTIYNDDRERNYFLQMYLGDYRALDYLASRPDWNGKILVATGTSMGGQQSFAVAGLHPKVTHLIAHVAAGADTNAARHGRAAGYPNWDSGNDRVMQTALYFDTVNFAPHIKATSLVSMGFVDTTCPAVGLWTAFNQIPGRKEAVPLVDAAHNNLATPQQQQAYTDRSAAWFAALVRGEEPPVAEVERH